MRVLAQAFALMLLVGCVRSGTVETRASANNADPALQQVIANYTGLYRGETLDRWETLFLPGFTAANTREDGTLNVRTRQEFFDAQRRYHARVDGLHEELEDVRVEQRGALASVWARYVVTEGAQKNRGTLLLLIARDGSQWRIHSLMFEYDR